jgi:hypothetical protein
LVGALLRDWSLLLAHIPVALNDLGVSEEDVSEPVRTPRDDDYALIRAALARG